MASQSTNKKFGRLDEEKWSIPNVKQNVVICRKNRDKEIDYFTKLTDPQELCSPDNDMHWKLTCRKGNANVLTEEFERILNFSLLNLRGEIQRQNLNAVTVLCAYVWRALKINEEINCITQFCKGAFERAIKMDEDPREAKENPLYGIPFSVKSSIAVAGYPITVGFGNRVDTLQTETNPIVRFLRKKGAILFCFTNVPQGLIGYATSNPLYGTTKNPWNFDCSPGGSSGGEAALLAAGGSAFGVGSDMTGGLRLPAAFCGVVTLKPTQGRLNLREMNHGVSSKGLLRLAHGFITRKVEDQEYLLRLIIGTNEYRFFCPESAPSILRKLPPENGGSDVDDIKFVQPKNSEKVLTRLRIGYFDEIEGIQNGESYDTPLWQTLSVIQPNCHLVKLDLAKIPESLGQYMASIFATSSLSEKWFYRQKKYTNEPHDVLMDSHDAVRIDEYRKEFKDRHESLDIWRDNQERVEKAKKGFIQYFRNANIHAIICPAFSAPTAPNHKDAAKLDLSVYRTAMFNLLDFPAGIVPVKVMRDPVTTQDEMPMSVQVVTLPNEEEMCLRVMQFVEEQMLPYTQHLKWRRYPVDERPAPGLEKSMHYFERTEPESILTPQHDFSSVEAAAFERDGTVEVPSRPLSRLSIQDYVPMDENQNQNLNENREQSGSRRRSRLGNLFGIAQCFRHPPVSARGNQGGNNS